MKIKNLTLFLLLAGLLAASCIREDLDDCPKYSLNELLLSYLGDGTSEIFGDKIHQVEVYVFDAENRCVTSFTVPSDQLEDCKVTLPELEPGEYRIVCLGNTYEAEVTGVDTGDYEQILFSASDYLSGGTVSGNDSLYYSSVRYVVTDEDQTQTAEFASSHYKVIVEVAGVPSPEEAGSLPVIQFSGVWPSTDFENVACGTPTDYYLESDYSAGLMTSRTNIMRHLDSDDIYVRVLTQSGTVLAEVNLADFLAANPVIDLTKQEILIPLRIEFRSAQVSVYVPEWYIQQVKPEF